MRIVKVSKANFYTFHQEELNTILGEDALTGTEAIGWRKELDKHYIPNKITMGGTKSSLPLLKDKDGLKSKSYLCINKTCSLPQTTMAELLSLINDNRDSSQIN